jgi:acetyl esterase/lipase
VDPDFVDILAAFPMLQFIDPPAQRAAGEEIRAQLPPVVLPDNVDIDHRTLAAEDAHPVPVRVYRAAGTADEAGVIVWIHGGGYCVGNLDEDEAHCARLAADLHAVVVSIDYRLAPEYPFPDGFNDCFAVVRQVAALQGSDYPTGPVVVSGASAGAGLAAAVALRARDEAGPRLRGQVLLYPFLDSTLRAESITTLADAPVFNADHARVCWEHYLGDQRATPPAYGSPPAARDLTALPPAYVLVAGADCLRDEAIDYAMRLQAAGVPVELHVIPDVPHGFAALLPTATVSRRSRRELNDVLTRMLAGKEETR